MRFYDLATEAVDSSSAGAELRFVRDTVRLEAGRTIYLIGIVRADCEDEKTHVTNHTVIHSGRVKIFDENGNTFSAVLRHVDR